MTQNRNTLIKLMIGNLSNAVIHNILEKAIEKHELIDKYRKEMQVSMNVAMKYRSKITPLNAYLQTKDINFIRDKITNKVNNELKKRIAKGYSGIDLGLVSEIVEEFLVKVKVK